MATPSPLASLLSRLGSAGLSDAPLDQAAPVIEEWSAEQIAAKRDSEELKSVIALAEEWWTKCRNARTQEEQTWFKNIDMVQGRQFTMWDANAKKMIEQPRLQHHVRLSVNMIEPIIRTELTKTSKAVPTATVSPASNDLDDIMAAEAAEAAWDWFHYQSKFQPRVFVPANWWRAVTGTGFMKLWWDPSAEDIAAKEAFEAAQAAQQQAVQQAMLAMQSGAAEGPTVPAPPVQPKPGAIRAQFVSPFHLYIPNPAEVDLEAQPYVIHAYTLGVEEARIRFADRLPDEWQPEKVSIGAIVDLARIGVSNAAAAKTDQVLVREFWVKAGYSTALPKGGLIIMVGSTIVHYSDAGLPYEHGQFPFAMLTSIENGKFYRKSVVESITPLQNELNRTVSNMIERKNIATAPQMFFQDGALDPRRVTNRPGQYIPVKLGFQYPQVVQFPDLPVFVPALMQQLRGFMDDISGQHQVSRAISPGANTPASALSILQEADDDYLFTVYSSIDDAMEKIGRQALSLMVQFWDTPRLIKITGQDTSFDVQQLMGADLKNGTDLRVESGSSLPQSKSARIATISDMMKNGFIPPELGLEALEMGALSGITKRIRIDRDQAARENLEMRDLDAAQVAAHYQQLDAATQELASVSPVDPATGQPAMPPAPSYYPIGWMDNDQVHMMEHANFAKSQSYKQLPPAIQRVFEDHYNAHKGRAEQQMLQQMMMQAQQQPQPGGDGQQSQESSQPAA